MAKKDVLVFDPISNVLAVPQGSDEYQFSKNIELTEGVNLTIQGTGTLQFGGNSRINYPSTGTNAAGSGKILVAQDATGKLDYFKGIKLTSCLQMDCTEYGRISHPYSYTEGMQLAIDHVDSCSMLDYHYEQHDAVIKFWDDIESLQLGDNSTVPFSFDTPYQEKRLADTVSITPGDTAYAASAGEWFPSGLSQCNIIGFTGKLMGLSLQSSVDTINPVEIILQRASRNEASLKWEFVDSCSLSTYGKGNRLAMDHFTADTASFGDTGAPIRSHWGESLTNNLFHAGDTLRFALHFKTGTSTGGNVPTFHVRTKWGKLSYHSTGDSSLQHVSGYYDQQRYMGYRYSYGETAGWAGGGY